jgi:hypothetical protein
MDRLHCDDLEEQTLHGRGGHSRLQLSRKSLAARHTACEAGAFRERRTVPRTKVTHAWQAGDYFVLGLCVSNHVGLICLTDGLAMKYRGVVED